MGYRLSDKLTRLYNSDKFPWIIILVGIILRLIRYLYNPSLWSDEAVIAEDLINRSYIDFFGPSPDWASKHPVGFLMLEKFAINIFGHSEMAFRLFPFLFGSCSLVLLYKAGKYYLRPPVTILTLGLFAILDPLIFQSSNIKPYSGDLAFALIILLGAKSLYLPGIRALHIFITGAAGAVIIWFSNTIVFVLAGIGLSAFFFNLKKKQWHNVGKLLIIFMLWMGSFLAYYLIYVQGLIENTGFSVEEIVKFEKASLPIPPTSISDVKILMDSFFELFKFPVGLSFKGLAGVCFIIGCISIYRNNRDNFVLLISPVMVTLMAAVMEKYAFTGRLVIFLVPFFLIFISEGLEFIREKISSTSTAAGIVLVCILFAYPLSWAAYHAKKPSSHEEIRPVISYIKDNWKKGDIIYVHYYSQYPFMYYTNYHPEAVKFKDDEYIIGIAPKGWYRTWRKQDLANYYNPDDMTQQTDEEIFNVYIKDLEKLNIYNRVWAVFSSKIYKGGVLEEKFFTSKLEETGRQIDFHGRSGVSAVYLYDIK